MKNKKLREALIRHFIFTISLYTFIYLFKVFTDFYFSNPFQWIIDIPTYKNEDRGFILFGFLTYQITSITIIYQIKNFKY
jgi:hypothetical protein